MKLTPIRREILDLMAAGCSPKQTAAAVKLSEKGVQYHMTRIRRQFGVANDIVLGVIYWRYYRSR